MTLDEYVKILPRVSVTTRFAGVTKIIEMDERLWRRAIRSSVGVEIRSLIPTKRKQGEDIQHVEILDVEELP